MEFLFFVILHDVCEFSTSVRMLRQMCDCAVCGVAIVKFDIVF